MNIKTKNNKKSYIVTWTGLDPFSGVDTREATRPWTTIIEAKNILDAHDIGLKFACRGSKGEDRSENITSFSVTELRSDTYAKFRNDSKVLTKLIKAGLVTEDMLNQISSRKPTKKA